MTDQLLGTIVVLLAAALAVALLLRRLNAPTLVGYILAGILLGPSALGAIHPSSTLELLAEVGVQLLMFNVGLEFSVPVLLDARRAVFGVGGAQVLVTAGIGTGLTMIGGMELLPALLVGGAVAMSSTAVTLRQLADQEELKTRHGRLAVGTLLFQDLATLPFLVLVAALGTERAADPGTVDVWLELGSRLGVAVAAFLAVIVVGRRLLTPIVAYVAETQSEELFMLTVLLLVLGAALAAHAAGLSPPLGAFLAGMILGETRFRQQAERDIRPFRDVFLGLFFITVGLRVDLAVITERWLSVALILGGLIVGKWLIVVPLVRLIERSLELALRASTILAHGGEFGLLILTLALGQQVLGAEVVQPLLGALVLSMMIAPFMIRASGRIASGFVRPTDRR